MSRPFLPSWVVLAALLGAALTAASRVGAVSRIRSAQRVESSTTPQQLHLSIYNGSEHTTSITITWVTTDPVTKPVARLGASPSTTKDLLVTTKQFNSGTRQFYSHSASAKGLTPGKNYVYSVGDSSSLTPVSFSTPDPTKGITYAMIADMGFDNAQALPQLVKDFKKGQYQMLFHIGDIAYDLQDDNSKNGDKFMSALEPVISHVPYQVAIGNHEKDVSSSYLNYRMRFKLHDGTNNMYYSFNSGLVHFLVVASEFYYDDSLSTGLQAQYSFILDDLAVADSQRFIRPWVVVLAHRPFYCSNTPDPGFSNCSAELAPMRDGVLVGNTLMYGLETVFHKYKIDFFFTGHKHAYERFYPSYKGRIAGTGSYHNPMGIVMVTLGNAGNSGNLGHFVKPDNGWLDISALRIRDYGYVQFTPLNATAARVRMISSNGSESDNVLVTKTKSL